MDQYSYVKGALGLPVNASNADVLAAVDKRVAARRDNLVARAVAYGRIPKSLAAAQRAELDRSGVEAEKVLAALPTPSLGREVDLSWFPQFPVHEDAA